MLLVCVQIFDRTGEKFLSEKPKTKIRQICTIITHINVTSLSHHIS